MQEEEDEISLVDLLVVLIKHRRLIIAATSLSAIAVATIFFVLPLFGIVSFGSYTIRATAVPSQIPPALEKELGIKPELLAQSYAENLEAVAAAVSRNRLMRNIVGDEEGWLFRTTIARSFIGQKYKIKNKEGTIDFEVAVSNARAGENFLREMITYVDARLRSEIASRSTIVAESMESLRTETSSSTSLSDNAKQLIISSETYRSGKTPALVITSEPEILVDSQGRAKNAVIIVMGTFFLAVFLAFILDYIDRLKADPESSAKIRKALGK
jgi:hypothetical protein